MQDPLKQGLKLFSASVSEAQGITNSNARSIKTRIETNNYLNGNILQRRIRMQDPLKQGLKLSSAPTLPDSLSNSNARSIKTRIETVSGGFVFFKFEIRMQDPLKQGLKPGFLPRVVLS